MPEAIAEHLDLDMAGCGREELLDVDRRVAKGPIRIAPHTLEGGCDLLGSVRGPHPVTTTTGRGLDRHGIAEFTGYRGDLGRIRQRILGPGNDRYAGRLGRATSGDLAPHGFDRFRRRPDEDDSLRRAASCKRGVFREKAITGMNRLDIGFTHDLEDAILVEVALRRHGRSDRIRLIRCLDMRGPGVGI